MSIVRCQKCHYASNVNEQSYYTQLCAYCGSPIAGPWDRVAADDISRKPQTDAAMPQFGGGAAELKLPHSPELRAVPSSFVTLKHGAGSEIAIKHDSSKAPWQLLPFDALEAVVAVLKYGADKYEPRNWERGFDWGRPLGAMFRHAVAFWKGEDNDPESGLPHTAHMACNALFLLAHTLRKIGRDDRPVKNNGTQIHKKD